MLHKHIFKKYIEEQVSSKLMIEDYMELYDDWTKAFSISAQGGALFFG
jgi:hypothetical protein